MRAASSTCGSPGAISRWSFTINCTGIALFAIPVLSVIRIRAPGLASLGASQCRWMLEGRSTVHQPSQAFPSINAPSKTMPYGIGIGKCMLLSACACVNTCSSLIPRVGSTTTTRSNSASARGVISISLPVTRCTKNGSLLLPPREMYMPRHAFDWADGNKLTSRISPNSLMTRVSRRSSSDPFKATVAVRSPAKMFRV